MKKIDINTHDILHIDNQSTAISKQNMNFLISYGVLKICYDLLLLLFQASFLYVHKMLIMEKVYYIYISYFQLL